jgi:magnesium transporter
MQTRVVTVPAWLSHREAGELFHRHRLLALPVVDETNRLVGLVDVTSFTDEMFDIAQRDAAEDVFQLIGLRLAQSRSPSPLSAFRQRFPWLLCNVAGGMACALILSYFEHFLDTLIVLALFIPVVLAVTESVSMQSMSVTLQALHRREKFAAFMRHAMIRELVLAALLGLGAAAVVGGVAYAWKGDGLVAGAIGGTVFLSIITASLLGVALPACVHAFRGDPRIAAGPIVLAVADLVTLTVYFNLAGAMLAG